MMFMMSSPPVTVDPSSGFEEKIRRIEEIVNKLESGNVTLEKSLELFEEGSILIRSCEEQLDTAEQKVSLFVKAMGNEYG